jgi:Iron-containing redox enzyme
MKWKVRIEILYYKAAEKRFFGTMIKCRQQTLSLEQKFMEPYLKEWEESYKKRAGKIALFTDASKNLDEGQKIKFIRLFYHARGHFYRFLWIMASYAPSMKYRSIILQNITDELGGIDASHLSHEQLFFIFAEAFDKDIHQEVLHETMYLPFLKDFDQGHVEKLLNSDFDEKWAIFSAYELLDNTDYNNLYQLALNIGTQEEGLVFFDVHRTGNHFGETFVLLQEIWDKNPQIVKDSLDFIGNHQLAMWQGISDEVFGKIPHFE